MFPYLLPLASPSHPPYPTPLSCHKAPSWSPCAMWLLPTSFFFFILFYLFFYTAGSYYLSILYTSVYTCQSQSPNSSHHQPPTATFPPWCPYVCSLHLYLSFCPANWFICTIFLGPHICVNIRYLFFSFWLTSLCMTVSRSIHVSTNDRISFLFMAD